MPDEKKETKGQATTAATPTESLCECCTPRTRLIPRPDMDCAICPRTKKVHVLKEGAWQNTGTDFADYKKEREASKPPKDSSQILAELEAEEIKRNTPSATPKPADKPKPKPGGRKPSSSDQGEVDLSKDRYYRPRPRSKSK